MRTGVQISKPPNNLDGCRGPSVTPELQRHRRGFPGLTRLAELGSLRDPSSVNKLDYD